MSDFHVVDSSGWLEYLLDSDRASLFADAIEDTPHLIVPVITLYEVYKKTLRERGEDEAREAALAMQTGRVIDLDVALALEASRHPLPLADSLIYATTPPSGHRMSILKTFHRSVTSQRLRRPDLKGGFPT